MEIGLRPTKEEVTKIMMETYKPTKSDEFYKWVNMFGLYNLHNKPKLGMGCRPCYDKVYDWIVKNHKNTGG